jgi:hypothetical protein
VVSHGKISEEKGNIAESASTPKAKLLQYGGDPETNVPTSDSEHSAEDEDATTQERVRCEMTHNSIPWNNSLSTRNSLYRNSG